MKNIYLIVIVVFISFQSCVQEDYFGYSPFGNIKNIEISNQASQAVITTDSFQVSIEIPPGVDASALTLKTLKLSSFASADKLVGDKINLTKNAIINVTAENGDVSSWTIIPFIASAEPQLQNGDFNAWYQTSSGYYEPGESASTTIWGTGNPGTQTLNLLATTPLEIADDNLAARMETLDNGFLAGTFGMPISAGSIFTGYFDSDNINPTDPEAAIDFGTPFAGRPAALSIKYQYSPGEVNEDKKGNVLPYGDMFDIYALLEIRHGNTIERLATAWFRSGEEQAELTTVQMEFTYGELDASYPDYMYPANGLYVSADSASFLLPTHITFVASSSFDGANFAGAIGSELVIDDLEFLYEE